MADVAPLDDAVRIAADYLTDHEIVPQTASPQLALNALASWASHNRGTEVGRWMWRIHWLWVQGTRPDTSIRPIPPEATEHFNAFRTAWQEYVDRLPALSDDMFLEGID